MATNVSFNPVPKVIINLSNGTATPEFLRFLLALRGTVSGNGDTLPVLGGKVSDLEINTALELAAISSLSVGGEDQQIQFNENDDFSGSVNLTWDGGDLIQEARPLHRYHYMMGSG